MCFHLSAVKHNADKFLVHLIEIWLRFWSSRDWNVMLAIPYTGQNFLGGNK